MTPKKILLSGIKPTGRPHIANYFGAMKQMLDLQVDHECFIMIADLHALNSIQDSKLMKSYILDLALDYLAIGLDPKQITLFKQSAVPAHAELAWIFDTITTMPYLMRAHAFKDAEAKSKEISVGTFNYPVLMAADILLYNTDIVPVGSDQKQHVEYARDIAEKFNRIFGDTFKLPESYILETVATIPGLDGRKMSKSYNNHIPLFSTDEEIKNLVAKIVTDSKAPTDQKDPDTCNIFALHKLFSVEILDDLSRRYTDGEISYKESKDILAENIIKFITPLREKREALAQKPEEIIAILDQGQTKANTVAEAKLHEVKINLGLL